MISPAAGEAQRGGDRGRAHPALQVADRAAQLGRQRVQLGQVHLLGDLAEIRGQGRMGLLPAGQEGRQERPERRPARRGRPGRDGPAGLGLALEQGPEVGHQMTQSACSSCLNSWGAWFLYWSSGFLPLTRVWAGTDWVMNTLLAITAPSPMTVSPPRIEAPE